MKTILILIMALTLSAKDLDCKKLLKRAISDLNYANKHKHISVASQYSTRSTANLNLFSVCVEVNEDYNIAQLKKELKKVK